MLRIIGYTAGLLMLILLQTLLFDNINLWGLVNPYVYIMFILLLPMNIRGWILLMLGFMTGMVMDLFSSNIGLHTIVTTWIAFVRPTVLHFTAGADIAQTDAIPTASRLGFSHFIGYLIIMSLLFSIPFFLLEVMTMQDLTHTILRILFSTLVTIVLIFFCQLPLGNNTAKV